MSERTQATPPLWSLWGSAAALSAASTALLYAAQPGINWGLTTLAVSLALLAFLGPANRAWRLNVVSPLAVACLLASGAAVTANPLNALVIAASVLFALGSAVVGAYVNSAPPDGTVTWVLAAPYASVLTVGEAGRRFAEATGAFREGRGVPVVRGIAIAAPVTFVLALLLCEADPTFAAGRDFLARAFRDLSILPRGVFFSVLTVCLVGGFGIALRPSVAKPVPQPARWMPPPLLGDTERSIVLGSVGALFALFLLLQVSYLFGNPGGRAGSGVSYAEAVHRGFVELNVAASVCCVLLLALRLYAPPDRPPRLLRALEWIVTLQAQILLVSAFYRVSLYESAYGFTRLRLYVQVYAAVAFVALILLIVELRAYPSVDRFLRRVMVAAALAFAGLVFGNSDAWIAQANLQRFGRTGRIDVPYLTHHLGPDAVPELVAELPRLPAPLGRDIAASLRQRYRNRAGSGEMHWFEWSLRRAAFDHALTRLQVDQSAAAETAAAGEQPVPSQPR